MTHSRIVAVLSSVLMLLCAPLLAAPKAEIPDEVKMTNSLPDPAVISAYLDPLFADMLAGNNAGRDSLTPRDYIVRGARTRSAQSPASSVFIGAYSRAVADRVKVVLDDKRTSAGAKVNASVIVADMSVDTKLSSGRDLEPLVTRMLADSSDAVALWGMKAAARILPEIVGPGIAKVTLPDQMVAAAKSHPNCGALATDAFDGFSQLSSTGAAQLNRIVQPTLSLLSFRTSLIATGPIDEPRAESIGITILIHPKVWDVLSAPQQLAAVQALSDLSAALALRAGDPRPEYEKMSGTIGRVCSAVVFLAAKFPNAQGLASLGANMAQAGNKPSPDKALALLPAVAGAMNTVPAFTGKINKFVPPAGASLGAPASSPTTATNTK